jgi:hypothetical protein
MKNKTKPLDTKLHQKTQALYIGQKKESQKGYFSKS